MRGKTFYRLSGAVIAGLLLAYIAACTESGEQQAQDKGGIEKMTDQAAAAAVKKIRTPADKARATRDLGDDRLEEMDRALQKQ